MSIRPAYCRGRFVGFSLWTTEAVGKVFASYKLAALALVQL